MDVSSNINKTMDATENETIKKKNNSSKVILLGLILGLLIFVAFSIILNPFSLNSSTNELFVKICFTISSLVFLTYLELNQNDHGFNWINFLGWSLFLSPLLFLIQGNNFENPEKTYIDIFILISNIIVWCTFVCLYSIDLIKAHNKGYKNWMICLCSIWLVIGVIQLLCYLPSTKKSFELITKLESVSVFFSLKSVLTLSFILYLLFYIPNEIDFKVISKVPKIGLLSLIIKTKYNLINSFLKAVQSVTNIFISILNQIIQVIGSILIFFVCEVPKLIFKLIKKFGKISLLIIPSIIIVCLLILIGHLIINYSETILEYIASRKRIEGKTILWPKIISILSVFLGSIVFIKLIRHISYLKTAQHKEFNVDNISFVIIYLLFLMTIAGVVVYFSLKNNGYELGIFSLVFSIISGFGLIWLIVSQFSSKKDVSTE